MGLDIYFDKRIKKDEYIDVAYWRRRQSIIGYVNEVLGFNVENSEHEQLNKKQILKVQDLILERWGERDNDDEKEEFQYDMRQISEVLLELSTEEFIYFMASW